MACQMIYASTRNSVTKSLGATSFVDTIFATSKEDLTPEGYAAHKRHLAAPKPMSAREKEMADIKAAEREAGSALYNVNAARQSPFQLSRRLKHIKFKTIDPSTETLTVNETAAITVDELRNKIPSSDPCEYRTSLVTSR